MELRDYLRILWRRRWLIALCIAVTGGAALAFSSRITPKYEAKAQVFVGPRSIEKGDAAGAIQELTFSQEFVASYAAMLKSRQLSEVVVSKTNPGITGAQLAEKVGTKIVPDTRLIEVSVTDPSPDQAQILANAIVNTFVEDPGGQFGGGNISASVFEPALRPTTPKSPRPLQNGLIAGFLGGVLGISAAFLIERLDTAVRTKEDLERALAPLPVIAEIPLSEGRKTGAVFIHDQPDSPQAEALRMLRTNVQFFSIDRPVRKALVTSPFAGDGKTTVATNLAASMAALGSTVLLLETDLRKPVLHDVLQVKESPGLSNVLVGQAELSEAVQATHIPNLYVLTAGTIPPNPSELLGSEKMVRIIAAAEVMAEIVLLDSPPALPVTDAAVLAPHTDGVILVVRSGRTPTDKAVDVVRNLERHDVRMLGVVLNGIERDSEGAYYYQYRHYRSARATLESLPSRMKKSVEHLPAELLPKEDSEFWNAPRKPARRPTSSDKPDEPRGASPGSQKSPQPVAAGQSPTAEVPGHPDARDTSTQPAAQGNSAQPVAQGAPEVASSAVPPANEAVTDQQSSQERPAAQVEHSPAVQAAVNGSPQTGKEGRRQGAEDILAQANRPVSQQAPARRPVYRETPRREDGNAAPPRNAGAMQPGPPRRTESSHPGGRSSTPGAAKGQPPAAPQSPVNGRVRPEPKRVSSKPLKTKRERDVFEGWTDDQFWEAASKVEKDSPG